MNAEPRTTEETQDDLPAGLVAYLDGELDAEQARAVEERLSRDAEYRRQLRELQGTWDLLDHLPTADVDDSFTRTTIAMVAVSAADEVERTVVRRARGRRWLWWTSAIAAATAFAAGYAAVWGLVSRENQRLLRDLPVIQRLDQYRYADNLEFLRLLDREGAFTEDESAGAADTATPQGAAPEAGGQDLRSMPATEKKELQGKQERFYRLDAPEQDRLRQLHVELSRASDAKALEMVLDRYARWLQTLPSGERADLSALPPADRVAEIKRLLQGQAESRMQSYVSRKLSGDDLRAIARWMEETIQRREPEILKRAPMLKEHLDRIPDAQRRVQALVFMTQRAGVRRELLKPTAEDIERLKSQLSPAAREDLEKARSEGHLPELAEAWMRATIFSRFAGPPVDREQLRRFYKEDLEPQQRAYLESLPPERMQSELVKMYHAYRFRRDGFRDLPGGWKPGPGLRGFPPRFGPGNREPSEENRLLGPAARREES